MLRLVPAALVVGAALALAGCSGSADDAGRSSAGAVTELSSVGELRDAFRRDAGVARIVLLLSPT